MNAKPLEELDVKISFEAEVYYFTFATLLSVFLFCSAFAGALPWPVAILSFLALSVLPFLFTGLIMIIKLFIRIAIQRGKNE